MRKMIMMAIAGYLWKKFQARGGWKQGPGARGIHRY
jgi:hypothetical protein